MVESFSFAWSTNAGKLISGSHSAVLTPLTAAQLAFLAYLIWTGRKPFIN